MRLQLVYVCGLLALPACDRGGATPSSAQDCPDVERPAPVECPELADDAAAPTPSKPADTKPSKPATPPRAWDELEAEARDLAEELAQYIGTGTWESFNEVTDHPFHHVAGPGVMSCSVDVVVDDELAPAACVLDDKPLRKVFAAKKWTVEMLSPAEVGKYARLTGPRFTRPDDAIYAYVAASGSRETELAECVMSFSNELGLRGLACTITETVD